MNRPTHSRALLLLGALLIASSCDDATTPQVPGPPAALLILDGNTQRDTVGQELPDPLVVRVEDAEERPIEGQILNFVVVAGGGSVFAGSAITNGDGEARERWTLGTVAADSQVLEVRAVDAETGEKLVFATFHADALPDAPDSLAILAGDDQDGVVGKPLPNPIVVQPLDQYGNPVPGAELSWTTDDADGSFDPSSAMTDSTGVARTSWRLGTLVGDQGGRVTHGGVEAPLTAIAYADSVETLRLSEDTLRFGALGSEHQLTATMLDEFGNAVTDVPVQWSSSDPGIVAVETDGRVRSNSNGVASVIARAHEGADTASVVVQQIVISVGVTSSRDSILVGDMLQYNAAVADSNGVIVEEASLTWTSSDTLVAQVDSSGLVTGIGRGAAIVYGSSHGVVDSAHLTVLRPDSIAPTLSITSPNPDDVALPEIRITAACMDDDPLGCESLTVLLPSGDTLAHGAAAIDSVVSVRESDGASVVLTFIGRDPLNATTASRPVYVESSTALAEAETVTGTILDADAERILHFDTISGTAAVKIYDRGSGTETTLMEGGRPRFGYLSAPGAFFLEQSGTVTTNRLYEWRWGALIDHGKLNSTSSLRLAGDYAIWSKGKELYRYDIVSGTELLVATDAGNWHNDVVTDGDVVYWNDSYDIFHYEAGSTTQLTADDDTLWRNVYVLTDGTGTVYLKYEPAPLEDESYQITLLTDSGEVTLAVHGDMQRPVPEFDYAINDGWVTFTRPDSAGIRQVWNRLSDGTEQRLTPFDIGSRIESTGPGGAVILTHSQRRFLWTPDGGLRELGSDLGKSLWIDGEPYVRLGTMLLAVVP